MEQSDREPKIWVGKFQDDIGEFEILVMATHRVQAGDKIDAALNEMQVNPSRITPTDRIAGEPQLLYVEEVGWFDMVRPR